jgi:HSF-type DNA-binding
MTGLTLLPSRQFGFFGWPVLTVVWDRVRISFGLVPENANPVLDLLTRTWQCQRIVLGEMEDGRARLLDNAASHSRTKSNTGNDESLPRDKKRIAEDSSQFSAAASPKQPCHPLEPEASVQPRLAACNQQHFWRRPVSRVHEKQQSKEGVRDSYPTNSMTATTQLAAPPTHAVGFCTLENRDGYPVHSTTEFARSFRTDNLVSLQRDAYFTSICNDRRQGIAYRHSFYPSNDFQLSVNHSIAPQAMGETWRNGANSHDTHNIVQAFQSAARNDPMQNTCNSDVSEKRPSLEASVEAAPMSWTTRILEAAGQASPLPEAGSPQPRRHRRGDRIPHVYHDYSSVLDADIVVRRNPQQSKACADSEVVPQSDTSIAKHNTAGGVVTPFPSRLYQMLEVCEQDPEMGKVVGWLPHGRAFRVHNTADFTRDILPKFFKQVGFTFGQGHRLPHCLLAPTQLTTIVRGYSRN